MSETTRDARDAEASGSEPLVNPELDEASAGRGGAGAGRKGREWGLEQ